MQLAWFEANSTASLCSAGVSLLFRTANARQTVGAKGETVDRKREKGVSRGGWLEDMCETTQ
jgi:hypothetical protein